MAEVKGICYKQNRQFSKTQDRPLVENLDSLPWIDFSIFDIDLYIENSKFQVNEPFPIPPEKVRALPVNSARGCMYRCTFCYNTFQNKRYRTRSPQSVVAEVAHLIDKYELNTVYFSDELTFFSKKQALKFVETILESGIKFFWAGNCRSDLFNQEKDLYLIQQFKQAGCFGFSYALESADPEILKAMNKKASVEQFGKQTQLIKKLGLPVWTSLVFGYPQETPETIKRTFDVCIENKIYPSIGFLLPQPGSVMYNYALKHGFIKDEESYLLDIGDRQDLYLNMTRIPDKEFEDLVLNGAKRCNEILDMGLDDEILIKTSRYRSPRNNCLK